MNITRVKMVDKGLKGLEIWYEKGEDRGGVTFTNDHHVKVRVPVNSEIRNAFYALEKHFSKLLGLAKVNYSNVLDMSFRKGSGVVLRGKVNVGKWGEYVAETMFIGEDNEFPEFESLNTTCEELTDLVGTWMKDKTTGFNARQILMDFKEYGKENEQKTIAEYNFDEMSEEDMVSKAMEILEKKGMVILESSSDDQF